DLEFVQAGRIDRRLYIGLPDAKQRVQIFGVHSTGKQLAEDVEFENLVFRTVGYSGADIRNLVNEAGIMAVRRGHTKIYQKDIVDVLDKQLLEGMGVLLTEEEQQKCEERVSIEKKRLLAVHEAGHILLAHLFPRFDWHAFSQLLPGGKETAISVFYPREDMVDQGYTTFGYMMMQMVVAHGGRCAERVVFGDDVTDGGVDDLEKITKIAREMVISPRNSRLGFATLTNRVGLANRADSTDGELIKYRWDDPHVVPADMTVEVSELFTRELTRYIEETEELAMKGLTANRHILDLISNELLEKSRITGLEVKEKVERLSPEMFEDFVKPFQINVEEEGPLPHNDRLRYQPLDVYPAPLHRLGQTALKAASCKVTKHEKACIENQHVFISFAFDTFGFLAPEGVELLTRVQRVMNSNVMTPRSINVVFTRIGFAIQKGLAAQLVARLPSPTM
ncbi:ATP-dependent zinc metalloprotease FTSH 12, chloroplastic, partial [Tanacetum coccineum]